MSESQPSSPEILTKATITSEKIMHVIKTYNPDMRILEKPIQKDKTITAVIGKKKWVISSDVYYLLNFSLEAIEGQAKCVGFTIVQHMPPAKINGCDQIQKDIQQVVAEDNSWLPGVQFKDAYENAVPTSAVLKPA